MQDANESKQSHTSLCKGIVGTSGQERAELSACVANRNAVLSGASISNGNIFRVLTGLVPLLSESYSIGTIQVT